MTMRGWLLLRIRKAERTARHGRYAHVRDRAATRAGAYRQVLRQLERSSLDLMPRFTVRRRRG